MERFVRLRLGAPGRAPSDARGADGGGARGARALRRPRGAAGGAGPAGAALPRRARLRAGDLGARRGPGRCARRGRARPSRPSRSCTPRSSSPARGRGGWCPRGRRRAGARLVSEGVLGELLAPDAARGGRRRPRPRAGAGTAGGSGTWEAGRPSPGAASGTRPRDAGEFHAALCASASRGGGRARVPRRAWRSSPGRADGRFAMRRAGDAVELVSADDAGAARAPASAADGRARRPAAVTWRAT